MKLVTEVLYPNNARRSLNPSEAEGVRQQKELDAYKLAGLVPNEAQLQYANGRVIMGAAWKNPNWPSFTGTRKVWECLPGSGLVRPAVNPDSSYRLADFVPGSGFNFSNWHRSQADFYNSPYGSFPEFSQLPVMEYFVLNTPEAQHTNFAPGPSALYPIKMRPDMACRVDENGDIKWFNIKEFMDENPIVGQSAHIIPVPSAAPNSFLLKEIGKIVANIAMSEDDRMNAIRMLVGAPIPAGNTQTPSV